jgi:hypothetical protein
MLRLDLERHMRRWLLQVNGRLRELGGVLESDGQDQDQSSVGESRGRLHQLTLF